MNCVMKLKSRRDHIIEVGDYKRKKKGLGAAQAGEVHKGKKEESGSSKQYKMFFRLREFVKEKGSKPCAKKPPG